MATRLSGRVSVITADRLGAFIELDNDPQLGPKDNIWRLKLDHTNYNALFSLALTAAANRWPMDIRIEGDEPISLDRDAAVRSMGVGWKAG